MLSTEKIAITGWGAVSPLEDHRSSEAYFSPISAIGKCLIGEKNYWAATLPDSEQSAVAEIAGETQVYAKLDRSVHLALLAARRAFHEAQWERGQHHFETGINIGSARGTTGRFESHHQQFLREPEHLSALASPVTTAGSIGSWIGADLGIEGPSFSHSMTCSSGLFALGNAMAWLRSGMAKRFLAGGTEAPLTPFTLGQMNALKIYARGDNLEFPCSPIREEREKYSGLVLGEGAAIFAMEPTDPQNKDKVLAWVEGFGASQERPATATSVSRDGAAFVQAMNFALQASKTNEPVDAIFMHAPGTVLGDNSELAAIKTVFGNQVPTLFSTKWKTGHLFGASGPISLAQALAVLKEQKMPAFPYRTKIERQSSNQYKRIMINSAGFGGNAVSIIISHPDING